MPPRKVVRKRALSSTGKESQGVVKKTKQVAKGIVGKSTPTRAAKSKAVSRKNEDESAPESEGGSDDGSDFDDEDGVGESSEEEEADEVEEESSSDERPSSSKRGKKTSGGRGAKGSSTATPSRGIKGKELLKPGVKSGLGPGTEVVIRKPKARATGGEAYSDETIHPNTMLFLADLKANNDRGWLKVNDPDYRASLADFKSFIEKLSEKITEIDDTVPELPLKDLVFKIYRDVRFSKDPTPYKDHFSASWSRTGKKGAFAKYYLQIKPGGGSLIAGGIWQPEASQLAALRRDIDRRSNRLKDVLRTADLRKEYLGGVADDERMVVTKFIDHNKESALKTKPKGFDADHKDINLLRLRNFTVAHRIADNQILGLSGMDRICELVRALVPFITYLNSVVMPDEESSEEDESDSNEGEDGNDSDHDMEDE